MSMKAVILAGGAGTRLRPLTDNLPKPLVEVCGKPLLVHTMELLKAYGVKDIILSVGFLRERVVEYCGSGERFGLNISYVEEEKPLGTAGPLVLARQLLKETFIVSNGDQLMDIDIYKMAELHRKSGALCTAALTQSATPRQYGVARLDGDRICEFAEKPEHPPSNLINAGFYVMEPEVINIIPEGFAMLERVVFPRLAEMGRLFGFRLEGQWFDCGSIESLKDAEARWRGISRHA